MTRTKKGYLKLPFLNLYVKGSRCPWHEKSEGVKYGWNPYKDAGWGRFGGGWKWKLGIMAGGSTLIVEWIFGSTRICWNKDHV